MPSVSQTRACGEAEDRDHRRDCARALRLCLGDRQTDESPFLDFPRHVADRLAQLFLTQKEIVTDPRREPAAPCRLDQQTPRRAIARRGSAALAACAFTTGVISATNPTARLRCRLQGGPAEPLPPRRPRCNLPAGVVRGIDLTKRGIARLTASAMAIGRIARHFRRSLRLCNLRSA